MWPFTTKDYKNEEYWNCINERYNECKEFANVGEKIKYIGQEVTVVGYQRDEYIPYAGRFPKVGIHVEWFNTKKELQRAFIRYSELKLCDNAQKRTITINEG